MDFIDNLWHSDENHSKQLHRFLGGSLLRGAFGPPLGWNLDHTSSPNRAKNGLGATCGRPAAVLEHPGFSKPSWGRLGLSWGRHGGVLAAKTQQERGGQLFWRPLGTVLVSCLGGFWLIFGMKFQYFSDLILKYLDMS